MKLRAVFHVSEVEALEFRGDLHFQFGGLGEEVFVGELLHLGFESIDLDDERLDLLDVALVLRANEDRYKTFY